MADELSPEIQQEIEMGRRARVLLDKLMTSKANGLAFKKMIKAELPEAKMPDLDLIDEVSKPFDERIGKLEKTLSEEREERNKEKLAAKDKEEEGSLRGQLDNIKKEYGFTDEGLQKVIARMQEKKNPDVEAAAAWVAKQEPKAKPTATSEYLPQTMNLYGTNEKDETWEKLHKNPMKYFDDTVTEILNNPDKFSDAA